MFPTLSLKKRRRTLKKKAEELSTLCGIDVAYVCFEPNGRVDTWPEDPSKVKDIILKYNELKSNDTPSSSSPVSSSGTTHNDIGSGDIGELESLRLGINELSQEELAVVLKLADRKLERLREEIASLERNGETSTRKRLVGGELKTANLIDLVGLSTETEQEA